MYCLACGEQIPDDSLSCPECGEDVPKNKLLEFETELSGKNYIKVWLLSMIHSRFFYFVIAAFLLLLLIGFLYESIIESLLFLSAAMLFYATRLLQQCILIKGKFLFCNHQMTFFEESISVILLTPEQVIRRVIKWGAFKEWERVGGYYLLSFMNGNMIVIPRSDIPSHEITRFENLLREKIVKSALPERTDNNKLVSRGEKIPDDPLLSPVCGKDVKKKKLLVFETSATIKTYIKVEWLLLVRSDELYPAIVVLFFFILLEFLVGNMMLYIVIIVGITIVGILYNATRVLRQYFSKNGKYLFQNKRMTFYDENVVVQWPVSEQVIKWEAFKVWEIVGGYFLLYFMDGNRIIIPLSDIPSKEITHFADLLSEKIDKTVFTVLTRNRKPASQIT